jgi:hypothetical protein
MSSFKTANVIFENSKYNYSTSINGKLSDSDIIKYFKGNNFNLGREDDNMQKCIDCTIDKKSDACSLVLKAMDLEEDPNYKEILLKVIEDTGVNRHDLEAELNNYI